VICAGVCCVCESVCECVCVYVSVCKEVCSVVAISPSRSCCLGVSAHSSTNVHFKLQNVGYVCANLRTYMQVHIRLFVQEHSFVTLMSAHPSFCPRAFLYNTDECTSVFLS